jgi:hypothetical protein
MGGGGEGRVLHRLRRAVDQQVAALCTRSLCTNLCNIRQPPTLRAMAGKGSKKPKKPTERARSNQRVPTWKQFEQLVGRIEECLAPAGAVVKSPDRIQSNVPTQRGKPRKREVDASIRLEVGSAPVLITVETRKRNSPQDVLWIEQLATKKESVGASVTIAVSSTGFSEAARETARRHGILLRQLSEITSTDIRGWIPPRGLTHFYRHTGPVEAAIQGYAEPGDTPDTAFAPDVKAAFARDSTNARILTDALGHAVSLNDVWLKAQEQQDFFQGLPADGTPVRRNIQLRVKKGDLRVMTTSGPRHIREITFSADLSIRREEIPLDAATIVEYTPIEKPDEVYQRIEFTTTGASLVNVRLGLQRKTGSDDVTITVQPLTTPATPPTSTPSA